MTTVTIPAFNLSDPKYDLPAAVSDPLQVALDPLEKEDLTTEVVGGTGVFDALMTSIKAHLKDEYDAGRIPMERYTEVYIQNTAAALQAAVQFLLGKDPAYWQSLYIQQQARKLQIESAVATIGIDIGKAQLATAVETALLTEKKTALTDAQIGLTDEQKAAYLRDSKYKISKMYLDSWITQKTVDDGLTAPNAYTNATIDTVMTNLLASVSW